MKVLALRCSNTDFAHVVIEGTRKAPAIVTSGATRFPKGYDEHEIFRWFHQEIADLLNSHRPDGLAVKAAESMVKRSAALEARLRVEGIALMSAAESGCQIAQRKVRSTIAKDLGLKGKSRYLETKLDTSPILDFDSYNSKIQEAILVGWSCLD